jgi:hypothetical protein
VLIKPVIHDAQGSTDQSPETEPSSASSRGSEGNIVSVQESAFIVKPKTAINMRYRKKIQASFDKLKVCRVLWRRGMPKPHARAPVVLRRYPPVHFVLDTEILKSSMCTSVSIFFHWRVVCISHLCRFYLACPLSVPGLETAIKSTSWHLYSRYEVAWRTILTP